MSSSNLQGFSNLIATGSHSIPQNPKWLNSTDIIHSTQSALPVIDLAQADIESQSAAVTAQSRRIVKQAQRKTRVKTKPKKPVKKTTKKTVKTKRK